MPGFRRKWKREKKECFLRTETGTVPYQLIKSSRRRTMEISIAESMEVKVAVPKYASEKDIRAFLLERADWIVDKLTINKVINVGTPTTQCHTKVREF